MRCFALRLSRLVLLCGALQLLASTCVAVIVQMMPGGSWQVFESASSGDRWLRNDGIAHDRIVYEPGNEPFCAVTEPGGTPLKVVLVPHAATMPARSLPPWAQRFVDSHQRAIANLYWTRIDSFGWPFPMLSMGRGPIRDLPEEILRGDATIASGSGPVPHAYDYSAGVRMWMTIGAARIASASGVVQYAEGRDPGVFVPLALDVRGAIANTALTVIALASISSVATAARRLARRRRGCCGTCGYPVSGTSSICPECGSRN